MIPEESVVLVVSSVFEFAAMFSVELRNVRVLRPPITGIQFLAFAVSAAGPFLLGQLDLFQTNKQALWLLSVSLLAIVHCYTRQNAVLNNAG